VEPWRSGPTPHLSGDALEEYVFNRLPDAEAGRFEDHLLVCCGCRSALEETEGFIRAAKAAAAEYQANPRRHWLDFARFHRLPKFAALAAAVFFVAVILWPRDPAISASTVELIALRGGAIPMAKAHAGAELDLKIDLTGLPVLPAYRIEIVTASGRAAWSATVAAGERTLIAHVPKRLPQGIYWVRLYSESGELLREFGLKLG
jgi:hypothetical protein